MGTKSSKTHAAHEEGFGDLRGFDDTNLQTYIEVPVDFQDSIDSTPPYGTAEHCPVPPPSSSNTSFGEFIAPLRHTAPIPLGAVLAATAVRSGLWPSSAHHVLPCGLQIRSSR